MYYQAGSYYHFFNKGINNQQIFFNEMNYKFLTKIISDTITKYKISIIAYCFMPNHFHFLIRQDSDIPASKWIQTVFNKYVQAVNIQQNRTGTLFQGRVKRKKITSPKYLSNVLFYIHLNPIKGKLVNDLIDWEYSNYHECVGNRKSNLWSKDFIDENYLNTKNYSTEINEVINDKEFFKTIEDYLFE